MIEIRTTGSSECFRLYIEICLQNMLSRDYWKNQRKTVPVGKLTTVADEAFALLSMENNADEWLAVFKGEEVKPKGSMTKYTNTGDAKDGTKKGWNLEGKKRFNTIFNQVKIARAMTESIRRETWLMEEWEREDTERSVQSNRRGKEQQDQESMDKMRAEENFVPCTDFDFEEV